MRFVIDPLLFNESHLEENLKDPYVGEMIAKFVETGWVLNALHHTEGRVRNEAVEIPILGHYAIDSGQLASSSGVLCSTEHGIW